MTAPAPAAGPPDVDCQMFHPTLYVGDVRAAVDFYVHELGFRASFSWGDPPTIAGVQLGEVELHLSGNGTPNPDGGYVYFVVGDVDELHAFHAGQGVPLAGPPEDKPWGLRQYEARDLDGHRLLFGQHIATGPKLDIERVDVPVRLERRLAALLADLAAHKKMTVGECLEETLLHTFEKVEEGGVASPHTDRTHAHIEALKQKHGIDYDAHASYRFLEKP